MAADEYYSLQEQDKTLSACEKRIMKAIWDAGNDITIQELMNTMLTQFDKDYKRTTVMTFLLRLANKGYVTTYRKGRPAYIHALKTIDDYKTKSLQDIIDFWFEGDSQSFFDFACGVCLPTEDTQKKALKKIRAMAKAKEEQSPKG